MEQSALPRQLLALTSGMCLMKAKQLLQREDTDSARLRLGPTGTIPQCYQGSVGLQLHFQPDSRRQSVFWRPCYQLSLLWVDVGLSFAVRDLRYRCSVLAWIENSFMVAFFFFPHKPGTRNAEAYLPLLAQTLGVIKWQNKKQKFFLLFYHQIWMPLLNKWWPKRGGHLYLTL